MTRTDSIQRRRFWAALLFLAAVFALLLCLQLRTPLFADDYSYAVNFVTKEPITSLGDLAESQISHYQSINGRIVVHTIDQLLLWLGEPGCDILCALAFVGLCLLVTWHGLGSLRRVSPLALLLVFAGFWLLTPQFGSSFLWTTGAANYLFGILIVLLFFIPYRRALGREEARQGLGRELLLALLALLGGILAGWTNENTGAALLVLITCAILALALQKKPLRLWMFTGLLGALGGVLLIVMSPAQQNRLAGAGGMGNLVDWYWRSRDVIRYGYRFLWPLFWAGVLCALVLLIQVATRRLSRKQLLIPAVYLLGAGCSAFAMILSPQFPTRVWSGILALCLIVPLNCLAPVLEGKTPGRSLRLTGLAVAIALGIAIVITAAAALADLGRTRAQFDARAADIQTALAEGAETLTVEIITSDSPYNCFSMSWELEPDAGDWKNVAQANYWGLDAIRGIPPEYPGD